MGAPSQPAAPVGRARRSARRGAPTPASPLARPVGAQDLARSQCIAPVPAPASAADLPELPVRLALVDELVQLLEARFGAGIVYRLSRAQPKLGELALSSGSLGLDWATGIGGLPRGRLSGLVGGESCGKTSLAYQLLAEAQRDGGLAALIDGEGAADPLVMQACGVDLDDLILASPRDAAEALEMVEILVRCRALDAVVATALPPARPSLLDHGLRRLNSWLKGAPTAVVMVGPAAGERDSGPRGLGPAGLAFFASLVVRLELLRPLYGPGGDLLGLRVRALVAKNRLAAPGGLAELEILASRGPRRSTELVELGLRLGLVERTRQGLVWERVFLGRSLAAAEAELEADPDLCQALREQLVRRHAASLEPASADAADEADW